MVKGLGKVLRNLTLYQKKYLMAEKKGLKVLGELVASDAREILTNKGAVDTGLLRNSVRPSKVEVRQTGFGKIVIVPVGTNVHYAPYVEFGTKYMFPKSYLFEALKKWSGSKGRNILAAYTRAVR